MAGSEVRPMHAHLQGLFLLLILAILALLIGRAAGPTLGRFFEEDGAIYAEAGEDEEPTSPDEVPLTGDEVARLQRHLTTLGFEPGPVDGIAGEQTDKAIAAAINEYQLAVTTTDRQLLDYASSLISALDAADAADSDDAPGDETIPDPSGDG